MKRHFTLLFFLIFLTSSLKAQEQNINASIDVSARVIQSIELITVNTISFSNAQPGEEEIYVNPINSNNAGFMIAVGTPEAEFRLNYLPERTLTQVGGDATLTFSYELSGNTEEDQPSAELLDFENRNIQFNLEGRYYIWVGGRVDLSEAVPGNYQGDFTIEIDYI